MLFFKETKMNDKHSRVNDFLERENSGPLWKETHTEEPKLFNNTD